MFETISRTRIKSKAHAQLSHAFIILQIKNANISTMHDTLYH